MSSGWLVLSLLPESSEPPEEEPPLLPEPPEEELPPLPEPPEEDKPQAPVTGETKPIQPDKSGNAAVDNNSVQSAIDKAKQDAKENGTTENGIAVTVPITSAAGQTSFNVTIKAQTLDLLVKENVRQFTVEQIIWFQSISAWIL